MSFASNAGRRVKHFIEDQTKRVEIALLRRLAASQLLRRHVGRSSTPDIGSVQLIGNRSETEVHDAHFTVAVDHDVARFEVAVQHALWRARPPDRRTASAQSLTPLSVGSRPMRFNSAEDPRRQRTPSTDTARRGPRRCRRRGTRSGGDLARETHFGPAVARARVHRTEDAVRNFSATGCPSSRSWAR
jgi:hypothetical protein